MPIDNYKHDFDYLVKKELPVYRDTLEKSIQKGISMSLFSITGVGIKTLCQNLGVQSDFSGCYLLLENGKPVYTGISKNVLNRLRQHVRGRTHNDASLAYKIAANSLPHTKTRAAAMEEQEFAQEFKNAKDYLNSLSVAFVEISNPLSLYIFEPYCAMKFDTCLWNTFETH